jgi:hypothetical protein
MIGGRQIGARAPGLASAQAQALEGLRRGHFVQKLTVNVEERRAIGFGAYHVGVPEFVIEGFASHCRYGLLSGSGCTGRGARG